jgi:hypothetical protein
MNLQEYINEHFGGNQAAFARRQDVHPTAVTKWLNNGYMVIGDDMVSKRRVLKRGEDDKRT